MMGSTRDRWTHQNSEISELHDYDFELNKLGACPGRPKRIATLMTSKHRENNSLSGTVKSVAAAMTIHFLIMSVIWIVIVAFTFTSSNQIAPLLLKGNCCGPCPENWLCYRNHCYQFFNESKTWYESQVSCMKQNSTLLKIYDKDDQDFLKLIKSYHWMGLTRYPPNGSWQWEDGSFLSPEQLTMVEMQKGNCAVYGSSFKGYTENCSTTNTYICMQRIDL